MKSLTREQTAGTLTFFFPQYRDEENPPEITVMVRRVAEDEWHAGLAMCSAEDSFSKQRGRLIAFHRLQGIPFSGASAEVLLRQLTRRIGEVDTRHRRFFGSTTYDELPALANRLEAMRIE
jgi:hypothetical protein